MVKRLAALALLANAFAWGVSWLPFRELQSLGVHPLWSTALIYTVALLALLLCFPGVWRSFAAFPQLWLLALAAGMTNIGFNWAVTVGDVVRVVLLFYLMPGWVVLLAWPLLGEKPRLGALSCLALALLGVFIILQTPQSAWPWPQTLADWLALMAGFCFALTNILLRLLKSAPPTASILAMFLGGALMSALAALTGSHLGLVGPLPAPTPAWLGWIGLMSLMFMLGNLGLQYGAARLSASVTATIMLSEVVFASVSALALGAGQFTWALLAGGLLIGAAALCSVFFVGNGPASSSPGA